MAETVEVTFRAPEKMVKAVEYIRKAFNITIDEYMTNAIRGELQGGWNNNFIEESGEVRDQVVREVLEILGEEP